ncbi:MAG TPA: apolipoprotein N-acyltransferase [Vicinamibacteria bacterium]|nr:apolipoprotein N-acyltransferase [Vicinamibacteria bacterium]
MTRWPLVLALASGVLAPLGFAGFALWPLAFVAYVPLLAALDQVRAHGVRAVLLVSLLFGFPAMTGGYYWLFAMLQDFSGFPPAICLVLAGLLILYTSGLFVAFGWLWARCRDRGHAATPSAVAAMLVVEMAYPLLFPYHYGSSLHPVPLLLQTADLGGPALLTALVLAVNGAVYEASSALVRRTRVPRASTAVAAGALLAAVGYGLVRMPRIDEEARRAPHIRVGLVQANMGIHALARDPEEGHRRHLELSRALEKEGALDLLVWPESSFAWAIPETMPKVKPAVLGELRTPTLFGAVAARGQGDEARRYNTAFLTDADGVVTGTVDKTYLLAFGEYLPLGETFPFLYRYSPNTSRFTPASDVRALEFGRFRVGVLICYEDILPGFVRQLVRRTRPHLLVNLTNDAWFGDTHEPWIHLALAKLRAVEHRRYLVRATNTGVSAVVDPAGRVVARSGVFTRETLRAEVAMLDGTTPYLALGDWPSWAAVPALAYMALRSGRRSRLRG